MWLGENETATDQRAKLQTMNMRLHKFAIFVRVTRGFTKAANLKRTLAHTSGMNLEPPLGHVRSIHINMKSWQVPQ